MDTESYFTLAVVYGKYILFGVSLCLLLILSCVGLVRFLERRALMRRSMVWLEVTPPASITKTPKATEYLFSVIHGMRVARSLKDKLLRRAPVMSFEIVSTRQVGIVYRIYVESSQADVIQKMLTSYIPECKVNRREQKVSMPTRVIELAQARHYVFPLILSQASDTHDPLSYVTGALTQLDEEEEIVIQLVMRPVYARQAQTLSRQILGNENILRQLGGHQSWLLRTSAALFQSIASGTAELTSEFYTGATYGHGNSSARPSYRQPVTRDDTPARSLSLFESELMQSMHQKVNQPLFQVNLRVLITSSSTGSHMRRLRTAFDGFSVPPYQSMRSLPQLLFTGVSRRLAAVRRLPSLSPHHAMILSASELASLWHFPPSHISKVDNMVTSLSRTLPAPISLKQGVELDVVIGMNYHHGLSTPIGLTSVERERHMYIIGGTGNGKTTLLQYAIIQDMQKGKGLAVIDPHGDMAETILRHVPEDRIDDVVYFNPDDLEYPFGMNLLELSPDLTGNDLLREQDLITESIVSIFRKIFSEDDSGGHRIEYILRNAVHTALTVEDATLFTVLKLLQNPTYRRKITNELTDESLRDFWKNEFGKAGDMQKVKMSAGITAKIGRFNSNASAKSILSHVYSTIDFDDIMNSRKILICNFSKGLIGEDVSELFGITVLAKLQLASLRRARMKQADRVPYYLYVDEFQNFATPSFVQMLSESRKYRLFLTMAEQSTSQQKDQQMTNVILANVGTVITFRTGNPRDEQLLLPLFSPYISSGEIANLSAFHFFARLSSVIAQEPVSGQTILARETGMERAAEVAIAQSRLLYAQKKENIKKLHDEEESSNTAQGVTDMPGG